jgi:aspartate/methionine/tyrosine aminotransferase
MAGNRGRSGDREIVVCCGSTEAMISTLLAVCNKGDEVVIFEPFYENYGPDAVLSRSETGVCETASTHVGGW